MKKYRLACSNKRNSVDLRNYDSAVADVLPKATVIVEQNYYMIVPPPDKGDAIRIGKKNMQEQPESLLHFYKQAILQRRFQTYR